MKKVMIGSALALAAGVMGVPTQAAQPADAVPPVARASERASALAKLVVPEELVVLSLNAIVKRDLPPVLRADEDLRTLEAQYPGVVDAMIAAALPELVKGSVETVPLQQAKVAALLLAKMAPAEIEMAYAFYAGPTGQKIIRDQFLGFDAGPMLKEAIASKDGAITAAMMEAAQNEGVKTTTNRMTAEDQKALLQLASSPIFPKIQALGPEIQRITADVTNRPDPEGEARVKALMTEALQRFIRDAEK